MTENILAALLVVSNAGWMYFTHKLLNKLMSRSYHEYVQATAPETPRRSDAPADPEQDMGSLQDFISS